MYQAVNVDMANRLEVSIVITEITSLYRMRSKSKCLKITVLSRAFTNLWSEQEAVKCCSLWYCKPTSFYSYRYNNLYPKVGFFWSVLNLVIWRLKSTWNILAFFLILANADWCIRYWCTKKNILWNLFLVAFRKTAKRSQTYYFLKVTHYTVIILVP